MNVSGWTHETEGVLFLGLSLAASLTTLVLGWLLSRKRRSPSAQKPKKYSQRLLERFAKPDALPKGGHSNGPGKASDKRQ